MTSKPNDKSDNEPLPKSADWVEVRATVQRIADQLDELKAAQKKAKRQVRLITLVILSQIGVWGYASYLAISTNFHGEKVRQELQLAARETWPQIKLHVRSVREDVLPIFYEMASRRLEERGPELADDLGVELVKFAKRFPPRLQQQITSGFGRALDDSLSRLQPQVDALVAALPEPSQQEDLRDLIQIELEAENRKTVKLVEEYLSRDTQELGASIRRFNELKLPDDLKDQKLERLLLHFGLRWVDESLTGEEAEVVSKVIINRLEVLAKTTASEPR